MGEGGEGEGGEKGRREERERGREGREGKREGREEEKVCDDLQLQSAVVAQFEGQQNLLTLSETLPESLSISPRRACIREDLPAPT